MVKRMKNDRARSGHRVRVLGILLIIVVCGAFCVSYGEADSGRHAVRQDARQLPLWRLLPTRSFATLGAGHGLVSQWAAYAYRSTSNAGRAGVMPCISIFGWTTESTLLKSGICGRVQPSQSEPEEPPVYALFGASVESGARVREESVFAAGVPAGAARIRVRFEDARGRKVSRMFPTKKLTQSQGRKARVQPFHYVVTSIRANVCVDSIAGYDAAGGVMFDLHEGECPLLRP